MLVDLNGDGAPDLIGQEVEGEKTAPPVYLNNGDGTFRTLPSGYGNTVANVFTEVDAHANGHRDFFTTDTYGSPASPSYVVSQRGKPVRPGTPSAPVVTRSAPASTLWIPYDWGATAYQVWRAPSPTGRRTLVATTRLTRYVDTAADPHAVYWLRAANARGVSAYGPPG